MKNRFIKALFEKAQGEESQLVQIYGGKAVYMEGCKRILRCDGEEIQLLGAFPMRILGKNLVLKELGNDTVCAQGVITQIYFGD